MATSDAGASEPDRSDRARASPVESSIELLELARAGDAGALDRLCARYLPRLLSWASGRLPASARGLLDTGDMVQEVLLRSIRRLDTFEHRSTGGFHAYLRRGLTNRIRDEIRRAGRSPRVNALTEQEPDHAPSALEDLVGREQVQRYEEALTRLNPHDREAIIARIELGCSYPEVADTLGKPSADAARMAVGRALVRLAEEMSRERH
jgi:RNA polymerase sigma-70 factor (ECF subfamily)